ncbi:MAG TPA: ComEC/Rec2 family competence protein [Nevskiaceae bacterium]|nr:ComEC/Rec2 family competence protein [Nevskiaceae bacterium]
MGADKLLGHRMCRSAVVIAACLALLAGIGMGRFGVAPGFGLLWFLVPLLALSLRRQNILTLVSLAAIMFCIGASRGALYAHKLAAYHNIYGQKVTLVGRATDDGVYGARYQLTFGLSDARIVTPHTAQLVGDIRVGGFGAPAIYRGDVVRVTGKLMPAQGNAQAQIGFGKLVVLEHHPSGVDTLRRRFAAGLQSALPEPLASFGLGLLVGQRNTLPDATKQQLLMVGLTHIIAVSGYNLTIILRATRKALGNFSKFQATAACVALTGVFLLFTGNSPSIVRAAIVSMLSIAAWYYGRDIKPLVLLLVAASITALANPLYVWGNVSWYLSFLAFFGVLVLAPLVTKRLFGVREPRLLTAIVIESLCAEAMTLPYVLHVFGQMSFTALLANVLVVALVPLAMLLSLVAGLGGMLAPVVAGWLAWPARLLLTYMLDIATILSRVPHAFVQHVQFSFVSMLAAYSGVGFIAWVMWRKLKTKYGTITDRNVDAEGD